MSDTSKSEAPDIWMIQELYDAVAQIEKLKESK